MSDNDIKTEELIIKDEPLDDNFEGEQAEDSEIILDIKTEPIAELSDFKIATSQFYGKKEVPAGNLVGDALPKPQDHMVKNIMKEKMRVDTKTEDVGKSNEKLALHKNSSKFSDFRSMFKRIRHRRSDTFDCDLCNYRTTRKDFFKEHMEDEHPKLGKIYKCSSCKFRCFKKSKLNNHKKSHDVHFRCAHCDYVAKSKSSLIQHFHIHNPAKPYLCKKCDVSFRSSTLLKHHESRHQANPLKCYVCGFATLMKGSYLLHMNTHKERKVILDLECPECSYTTPVVRRLEKHLELYHPDKPYDCNQCEFKTEDNCVLVEHIKQHYLDWHAESYG